jgi:hypothetical protein
VLLLVALLLIEWRYWSAQERTRPALVCRVIVIALTALAAAGVELPVGGASQAVMFALDRSGSLPADTQIAALTQVNAMTSRMRTGDRAGVVAFGLDAALERPLTARLRVDEITSTISPAGRTSKPRSTPRVWRCRGTATRRVRRSRCTRPPATPHVRLHGRPPKAFQSIPSPRTPRRPIGH